MKRNTWKSFERDFFVFFLPSLRRRFDAIAKVVDHPDMPDDVRHHLLGAIKSIRAECIQFKAMLE
jgi:hypothetical protein